MGVYSSEWNFRLLHIFIFKHTGLLPNCSPQWFHQLVFLPLCSNSVFFVHILNTGIITTFFKPIFG